MIFDELFYPDYKNDPLLKHRETFGELVERIGSPEVFNGTQVDEETREALTAYFEFDRLCTYERRFLWFWRRRLNIYYPIYKDSLAAWAERKSKEWLFDNFKTEDVTHDGTEKLIEGVMSELKKILDRTFNLTSAGKTTDTATDTGSNGETYSEDRSGESHAEGEATGKDRSFAFRYPESNYQGGVIPYDITNNPNVEFIDSQDDSISKSNNSADSRDSGNTDGERSGTMKNEHTGAGTSDRTDASATHDAGTDNSKTDRTQDVTNHWTETRKRQGDNLNLLMTELIEQLPTTDFFLQFVKKLQPCFQVVYLSDEIIEEEGF